MKPQRTLILLAICAVIQPAHATESEFLSFSDTNLPIGWTMGLRPGSYGSNYGIRNGRFEVGQIDTGAYLKRSYSSPINSTAFSVDYTANLANVYWGMGTGVTVFDSTGIALATAAYGNAAYGVDQVRLYIQNSSGAFLSSQWFPASYGQYQIHAQVDNGALTFSMNQLGGNAQYSTGKVSIPGLAKVSPSGLQLIASTTTGETTWIDNVNITINRSAPKTYGLFIGMSDNFIGSLGPIPVPMKGAEMAAKVEQAFKTLPNYGDSLLLARSFTKDTKGNVLGAADIETAAKSLAKKMNPGDTMVVYLDGHGSEVPGFVMGNDIYADLKPSELSTIFKDKSFDGINKMFLLDFCYSGGFWSNGTHEGLDQVSDSAMISASGVNETAIYSIAGTSRFSSYLLDGLAKDASQKFLADTNRDGAIAADELASYLTERQSGDFRDILFDSATYVQKGDPVFIQGAGRQIAFEPGFGAISAEGNLRGITLSPVPEPAAWMLWFFGVIFIAFSQSHNVLLMNSRNSGGSKV